MSTERHGKERVALHSHLIRIMLWLRALLMLRTNSVWKIVIIVLVVLFLMTLRPLRVQAVLEDSPGDPKLSVEETAIDIVLQCGSSATAKPCLAVMSVALPARALCHSSLLSAHNVSRAPPVFAA